MQNHILRTTASERRSEVALKERQLCMLDEDWRSLWWQGRAGHGEEVGPGQDSSSKETSPIPDHMEEAEDGNPSPISLEGQGVGRNDLVPVDLERENEDLRRVVGILRLELQAARGPDSSELLGSDEEVHDVVVESGLDREDDEEAPHRKGVRVQKSSTSGRSEEPAVLDGQADSGGDDDMVARVMSALQVVVSREEESQKQQMPCRFEGVQVEVPVEGGEGELPVRQPLMVEPVVYASASQKHTLYLLQSLLLYCQQEIGADFVLLHLKHPSQLSR